MLRRFMASRAEPAYIVFYWTDFELNGNFSFSDGLHMLCSTHKILSLERGLAACDSRTLIAHFLHKQEKGKDNEHPQPVSGYEESQSERHAEGRAQDVPLVKGQCGEGEQTRGLLYRPLFPCRVQRESRYVFWAAAASATQTTERGKPRFRSYTQGRRGVTHGRHSAVVGFVGTSKLMFAF